MSGIDTGSWNARYAFRIRVRLESRRLDVRLEPSTAETTLTIEAAEPGTEGWLFFRDTLWRGEVSDPEYARELVDEWVDPPVEAVDFREVQLDEASFAALKAEIEANLELFNAESVSEVLSKYFGSSIRVIDEE